MKRGTVEHLNFTR